MLIIGCDYHPSMQKPRYALPTPESSPSSLHSFEDEADLLLFVCANRDCLG
jgi:hypothetical protein